MKKMFVLSLRTDSMEKAEEIVPADAEIAWRLLGLQTHFVLTGNKHFKGLENVEYLG